MYYFWLGGEADEHMDADDDTHWFPMCGSVFGYMAPAATKQETLLGYKKAISGGRGWVRVWSDRG